MSTNEKSNTEKMQEKFADKETSRAGTTRSLPTTAASCTCC